MSTPVEAKHMVCMCATHEGVMVTKGGSVNEAVYCPLCMFRDRTLLVAFENFVAVTRFYPLSAKQQAALRKIDEARLV